MDKILALRAWMLSVAAALEWLPPLVARITVGWVFVESGWGKLHNLPKVIDYFRELGIPRPELQAPFASGNELVCGALVLVGLLTRLASVPLIIIMIVAIVTARRSKLHDFSDLTGFIEYLYIALLLWIAVAGPGAISADRVLARALGIDARKKGPGPM